MSLHTPRHSSFDEGLRLAFQLKGKQGGGLTPNKWWERQGEQPWAHTAGDLGDVPSASADSLSTGKSPNACQQEQEDLMLLCQACTDTHHDPSALLLGVTDAALICCPSLV